MSNKISSLDYSNHYFKIKLKVSAVKIHAIIINFELFIVAAIIPFNSVTTRICDHEGECYDDNDCLYEKLIHSNIVSYSIIIITLFFKINSSIRLIDLSTTKSLNMTKTLTFINRNNSIENTRDKYK